MIWIERSDTLTFLLFVGKWHQGTILSTGLMIINVTSVHLIWTFVLQTDGCLTTHIFTIINPMLFVKLFKFNFLYNTTEHHIVKASPSVHYQLNVGCQISINYHHERWRFVFFISLNLTFTNTTNQSWNVSSAGSKSPADPTCIDRTNLDKWQSLGF